MAANPLIKVIALSDTWQPLADKSLIMDFTIRFGGESILPDPVALRTVGGTQVNFSLDVVIEFKGVDLAQIEAKGAAGTNLAITGYSR